MKIGQAHSGEGKYLVNAYEELPHLHDDGLGMGWDGLATIEPFFEGRSARILLIGEHAFGIWNDNPNSWIKNSIGAETEMWPNPPATLVAHARTAAIIFGLEIAGVDYVIGADGAYHFLEINQFPGLDVSDEVVEVAKKFLGQRMDEIEKASEGWVAT